MKGYSPIVGGTQEGHQHLTPANHASKGIGKTFDGKSMKLGGGGRFAKLKSQLANKPGINNPAGLAAAIGRKKLGGAKMAKLSSMGRKRE